MPCGILGPIPATIQLHIILSHFPAISSLPLPLIDPPGLVWGFAAHLAALYVIAPITSHSVGLNTLIKAAI